MAKLDRVDDWLNKSHYCRYRAGLLAAHCGITLRQLERFFLTNTGVSPQVWLDSVRMLAAVLGIMRGDKEFKEIAFDFGFTSPSHFGRKFKSFHGCSPGEFLKRYVAASRNGAVRGAQCRDRFEMLVRTMGELDPSHKAPFADASWKRLIENVELGIKMSQPCQPLGLRKKRNEVKRNDSQHREE